MLENSNREKVKKVLCHFLPFFCSLPDPVDLALEPIKAQLGIGVIDKIKWSRIKFNREKTTKKIYVILTTTKHFRFSILFHK